MNWLGNWSARWWGRWFGGQTVEPPVTPPPATSGGGRSHYIPPYALPIGKRRRVFAVGRIRVRARMSAHWRVTRPQEASQEVRLVAGRAIAARGRLRARVSVRGRVNTRPTPDSPLWRGLDGPTQAEAIALCEL